MAQEIGYRRQVAGGAAGGLPGASAAAFGAGIGAGVAAIGGALERANELDRQIRVDGELADFNRQFADLRAAADQQSMAARATAGSDHAAQMSAWWKDQAATLAEGISDRRARQQAQGQLADFGNRFGAAEHAWQQGAQVKRMVSAEEVASEVAENRAYRNQDGAAFEQELVLGRQAIVALTGVPDDVKDALIQRRDEKVATGYLRGVVDRTPAALAAMLDSGEFDALVPAARQEALRNEAGARIRAGEAQARAEASHAREVERDALGAAEEGLNAGAGTYQDRIAIADRYAALGDQSKAAQWRGKAAEFSTVQGSRDWTLPQLDERISTLTAKQNGAGLSSGEAHELAGLRDQRQQSGQRLDQPGGALAQMQYATGRTLEPVDLADPASMQRRAAQAVAAARTYGRQTVEPLLDAELDGLKDLAAGGAAQRLRALDSIRGFGDPRVIAGAARQVAGAGDGAFRIAATLGRDVARDVLSGDDTLKTNAGVWKEKEAVAELNRYYARALGFAGAEYRNDVMAAAKSYYAERMTRGGEIQWNPGRFAEAVEAVMGRTVDAAGTVRGGVARTSQGIVLVPAGTRPDDLLRQFARATPQAYAAAAGGRAPRWSDGTPMREAEFKKLLPTAIGGGRYGFRAPDGGLVRDDRGGIYAVRLADLK